MMAPHALCCRLPDRSPRMSRSSSSSTKTSVMRGKTEKKKATDFLWHLGSDAF